MNAPLNANPARNLQMKNKAILSVTSLLAILFFAFHWADDIVRGRATGGVSGLVGVLILVIWLHGTLVLGERARGTAIGVRHHAARVDQWVGCPCHPHEGSGTCRRQDCQFRWSLFLVTIYFANHAVVV